MTSLQQELETTKKNLERDLAASKLDSSSKNDELAEARRLVAKLEEEICKRKPLERVLRDSEVTAATNKESDAVYSSEETRRLIQSVQTEIKLHKARKLALADTIAGNLNLAEPANISTAESMGDKIKMQEKLQKQKHSFQSAMSGSVDTEAMKSFAEDSSSGKVRGPSDHSFKTGSMMSATMNSETLKSFSEDAMEEEGRAASPDLGTVGSYSLKSSVEEGRPEPGSIYSGITGSYTDDISLKNHVPHPARESGSVMSGISGCDSLHTSDDDRMFTN